ncbi:unnamed protein product [Mytilus edulis]|uniref:Novel STAND NTPase 3 domain-containing protein n=1 Tax=Mytilus edulis TaxID=6550 RepID=A0A8S3SS88_MYTED|nr:unnamed protein product [Mytilus edulis]
MKNATQDVRVEKRYATTPADEYHERKRWQKKIRALETSGEHPNKRIKDTTEELKIEKDNVIPSNINDQTRKSIDEWEVKSKSFVETRAYIKVLEEIVSNSCVAVTGPSGAGKSAIVQAVSLSLSKENGYKIIKLLCPMDLRNYYSPGKKTVFILEDFCGKFTAREDQINDWCSMQDVVNQVVEDESCKILFSCRLQVYKDPKFDLLPKFQLCECNIISSELCLTEDEKKQIFNSHLSSEKITDNILFRKIDNFPFLCQYRSIGKNNLDIDKYFVKSHIKFIEMN